MPRLLSGARSSWSCSWSRLCRSISGSLRFLAASHAIVLPIRAARPRSAVFAAERAVTHQPFCDDLGQDLPRRLDQCDLSTWPARLERREAATFRRSWPTRSSTRQRSGAVSRSFRTGAEGRRARATCPSTGTTWPSSGRSISMVRGVGTRRHHGRGLALLGSAAAEDRRLPAAGARRERPRRLLARGRMASYARDERNGTKGPTLSAGLPLRRSSTPVPVRLAFRRGGVVTCREIGWSTPRPGPPGPAPDRRASDSRHRPALRRRGRAPDLAGPIATGVDQRRDSLPQARQDFRGRLVALFVAGGPARRVTFFLRSTILTHSEQDTLDHARTGLDTARRVLDDYLPFRDRRAVSGNGRRDLLARQLRGLRPLRLRADRGDLPADLRGRATCRIAFPPPPTRRSGSEAEATTGSSKSSRRRSPRFPGVPGVRSPGLLSLLLLPQRRVAEPRPRNSPLAVSAFSLLVFFFSAVVAAGSPCGSPVADLVEGTRAVARGNRLAAP